MKRSRKIISLVLSALLLLSVAIIPASAENGVAMIEPVASNIAKRIYTIPTASSGAGENAKDDDVATVWTPDVSDAKKTLVLDFAGTYDNLRKIEVEFAEKGVYRYIVEASTDNIRYQTIVDRSENKESAALLADTFYEENIRYVRLTLLDSASVAELRVFNYLPNDFVMGSDISYTYKANNFYADASETSGEGVGVYESVAGYGLSFARLRIWNDPSNGECGVEDTLEKARRIAAAGMDLGIDFHYGDTWCDPQKQGMPKAWSQALTAAGYEMPDFFMVNWNTDAYFKAANEAWAKLNEEQRQGATDLLAELIYEFTYDTVKALVEQGTVPKQIQIGNEITNGILWPVCQLPWDEDADSWQNVDGNDPSWDRFVQVLNAGTKGAKDALPEDADTQFVVHTTVNQGTYGKTKLMFEQFEKRGLDFDVIGISYYPTWHGSTAEMEKSLNQLCIDFPEYQIQLSETAYGASGNPPTDRPFDQPLDQFPMTVQGQADFLLNDYRMINDLPDGKGIGVLYWELVGYDPMYINAGDWRNPKYVANDSMYAWSKSITNFAVEGIDKQVIYTEDFTLPETAPVKYSQGDEIEEPVVWDAYDADALAALKEGERFVITGTSESDIPVRLIVVKSTSFAAETEYFVNDPMTFVIQTDASVQGFQIFNETDRKVSILSLDKTVDGDQVTWSIQLAVATAGDRSFRIVGKLANGETTDLANIHVNVLNDAPMILSVTGPEKAAVNELFEVAVQSSGSVKKVRAKNEFGRAMGISLVSKTVNGNAIDWVYESAIGTAGDARAITYYGLDANGVASEETGTLTIDIY